MNTVKINELLRQKADLSARLNLLPYEGTPEIKENGTLPKLIESASVNEDGVADVTMTVRLRMEATVDSLYFPLPLAATDIRLNDGGVNFNRGTSSVQVKLGNGPVYVLHGQLILRQDKAAGALSFGDVRGIRRDCPAVVNGFIVVY